MSDFTGTTRAQTLFLRAFHKHPHGPPPDLWPSPAVLRKWLRRPAFRRALMSLRDANRFRSAHHLSRSAAEASTLLHGYLQNEPGFELEDQQVSFLSNLLRLSQSADRFDPPHRAPKPATQPLVEQAATLQSLSKLTPPLVAPVP